MNGKNIEKKLNINSVCNKMISAESQVLQKMGETFATGFFEDRNAPVAQKHSRAILRYFEAFDVAKISQESKNYFPSGKLNTWRLAAPPLVFFFCHSFLVSFFLKLFKERAWICLKRGKDITNGGAVYNYHSICFLGSANTADSLYALKKLVFEEKKIRPEELLKALRNNFEGAENLRQILLNDAAKYGNDVDAVDDIAVEVNNHFWDLMDKAQSPLDGKYFVHLFSYILNLSFGHGLGATPDGRKSGEPLAYSLSAQQGRDQAGITAMLKSLSKLPHARAAGGSAAIIDIHPDLFSGKNGIQLLTSMLYSAIKLGIGQLQINVVSEERLKLAMADLENYGNIPVRGVGYSQIFKLLSRELQEHVTARMKHKE